MFLSEQRDCSSADPWTCPEEGWRTSPVRGRRWTCLRRGDRVFERPMQKGRKHIVPNLWHASMQVQPIGMSQDATVSAPAPKSAEPAKIPQAVVVPTAGGAQAAVAPQSTSTIELGGQQVPCRLNNAGQPIVVINGVDHVLTGNTLQPVPRTQSQARPVITGTYAQVSAGRHLFLARHRPLTCFSLNCDQVNGLRLQRMYDKCQELLVRHNTHFLTLPAFVRIPGPHMSNARLATRLP